MHFFPNQILHAVRLSMQQLQSFGHVLQSSLYHDSQIMMHYINAYLSKVGEKILDQELGEREGCRKNFGNTLHSFSTTGSPSLGGKTIRNYQQWQSEQGKNFSDEAQQKKRPSKENQCVLNQQSELVNSNKSILALLAIMTLLTLLVFLVMQL